ncbi:MAG: helix-turn-helix domain-containing protein [Clostridiales bacterium]|nr:helix-turn-helix domain-containing protein [Clostridiales bacterium]
MDCKKTGGLIVKLRREKGMTQKQLADQLHISDRTISKWERGLGCPDVSLLHELADLLGANIEKILTGDLAPNRTDGGNMKRLKFYTCPTCGNILTATGNAEVACCGRKLIPMEAKPCDEEHRLSIETVDDDFYITFPHEMSKDHFLNFVACVGYDRLILVRLYPEQGSEVRLPKMRRGQLYFGCSRHGLFVSNL